jgi:hypothetical protein
MSEIEWLPHLSHSDAVYLAVFVFATYWAVASSSALLNSRKAAATIILPCIWAASSAAGVLVAIYCFWRLV